MDNQAAAAAGPSVASDRVAPPGTGGKRPFWRRRPVIISALAPLAVVLFLGLHYVAASFTQVSTDDAFIQSTVVSVAPKVAGRVQRLYVEDNQRVEAGQLLLELDPRDFELELAHKKAAQTAAEANTKFLLAGINMIVTQVATAEVTVKQSDAEAASDEATADRTEADLKRAQDLMEKRIISAQEYDAAKAAAVSARAKWKASQEKTLSNRSKVSEAQAELEAGRRAWERAEAQAAETAIDVQQAEQNLSYTRLLASTNGFVTRKAVQEGDYVQVGQRLMALVAEDAYVVANFKETQLKHIRAGQHVDVSVDSLQGRVFSGRVQSIQAGSGAAFSLLPPENAVGNYVKVVQRIPVKIVFDGPLDTGHVLGPGMSVTPSVYITGQLSDVLLALAALGLTAVIAWLWVRRADRPQPGLTS